MRQESIKNNLSFLIAMKEHIEQGGGITSKFLCEKSKEHQCSNGSFYNAAQLGYFEKTERGKYKCVVGKFEPIHARKVLNVYAEVQRKRYKASKPIIKKDKKKKEFSILWGLVKIKY